MKIFIKHRIWFYAIIGLAVLALAFFIYKNNPNLETFPPPERKTDSIPIPLERYGIIVDSFTVIDSTVLRNENLGGILNNYNITPLEISILVDSLKKIFDVRKIKPGNKYLVLLGKDSARTARYFIYEENIIDFIVCKLDSPLYVYRDHKKSDTVLKSMSAVIDTSLWVDMIGRGASPELIMLLSDVFDWQIDFFSIYEGDKTKVIYQQVYVEGKPVTVSRIMAAWFENSDEDFYAFYYRRGNIDEYFDQKGNALRRMFLKAPLQFSRISSGFTGRRYHPVLRYFRPHYGVDYVAPRGTPVRTIGDGVVKSAGWSGGGGNTVVIKHNNSYVTAYNHLSGFGKGIHSGSRVRQGQIIGYVGSTGLSTGPHLDFRVWKNGSPVNPLRMKSPSVKALEKEKMPDFLIVVKKWTGELDKIQMED